MAYTVYRQYEGCNPEAVFEAADMETAKAWIFRHGGDDTDTFPDDDAANGLGYNLITSIEEDGHCFPVAWIEA